MIKVEYELDEATGTAKFAFEASKESENHVLDTLRQCLEEQSKATVGFLKTNRLVAHFAGEIFTPETSEIAG